MKYSTVKMADILTAMRSSKVPFAKIVMAESQFMWEQLDIKLKLHWQVDYPKSFEELMSIRKSLFKPALAVIDYSDELFNKLLKKSPNVPTIVRMTSDTWEDDPEKPNIHVDWLENLPAESLIKAFSAWLNSRGMAAEPEAITYGLEKLDSDVLKNTLDFIGLRDNNFISLKAIHGELEHFEISTFKLYDILMSLDRYTLIPTLEDIISNYAPQQILRTMISCNKATLVMMHAKSEHKSVNQAAEMSGLKPGALTIASDRVNSMHFNPMRPVMLHNRLTGLTLKLRRFGRDSTPEKTLKTELLSYFCDCGYLGS